MPVQTEQLNRIVDFLVLVDQPTTPGTTTLTAAAAAGATSLTVASISNFSANEPIRIGDGEECEPSTVSGTPSGFTINLSRALQKDHAIGQSVVEQVTTRYMVPEAAATRIAFQRESSEIFTADQRLLHALLRGYGSIRMNTRFTGLNMYNLCLMLGVPSTELNGTGASNVDPLSLVTTGAQFGTLNNASIIINGVRNDGANLRFELWGVAFDYSQAQVPLALGNLAAVPLSVLAGGGGVITSSANIFGTGSTTTLGTSGDVLQSLADVGYFSDTTPSTTTAGALTAGQTASFSVTSGASFGAGDIVRIDSGSNVEFKRIKTVVTNTVTLAGKVAKDHASGVAFTKQLLNSFAAIGPNGFNLAFNGQVSEVRNGLSDMAAGLRYGGAGIAAQLGLLPYNLGNFARALGRPVPGGAVLPIINNLGATQLDGIYVRGTLQNAKTFFGIFSGNTMDVSGVDIALSVTGDPGVIPLGMRPTVSAEFQTYT